MKNKRGDGYIPACVMIVILCMLIAVIMTFASAVNMIRISERNARIVLDSFVMKNSIEIYNSVKNGNDYTEFLDNSEYISEFSSYNSLDLSGNLLYSYGEDGSELYRTTKPRIVFTEEKSLKIAAEYSITVPLYFAGVRVTEVTVPIKAVSKFNDKF